MLFCRRKRDKDVLNKEPGKVNKPFNLDWVRREVSYRYKFIILQDICKFVQYIDDVVKMTTSYFLSPAKTCFYQAELFCSCLSSAAQVFVKTAQYIVFIKGLS